MTTEMIPLNKIVEAYSEYACNDLQKPEMASVASFPKIRSQRLGSPPGRAASPVVFDAKGGGKAFVLATIRRFACERLAG